MGPGHHQLWEDLCWLVSPLDDCLPFPDFTDTSTRVQVTSTGTPLARGTPLAQGTPLGWREGPLDKNARIAINFAQLCTGP